MSATAVAAAAPRQTSTFKVLGAKGLFCKLPVVRSGTGRRARLILRSRFVQLADGGSARGLGLAGAVFLRTVDRSDRPLHPQARRRDPGVSRAGSGEGSCAPNVRRALGPAVDVHRRRRPLHQLELHHPLHANLRHQAAAFAAIARLHGNHDRRASTHLWRAIFWPPVRPRRPRAIDGGSSRCCSPSRPIRPLCCWSPILRWQELSASRTG